MVTVVLLLETVASPGNEVRGHNMNFFSPPLPVIFVSSETVFICLLEFYSVFRAS